MGNILKQVWSFWVDIEKLGKNFESSSWPKKLLANPVSGLAHFC